jgi:fatty-acyl-CoA synthase/long-chain acyl-CoA synthetase
VSKGSAGGSERWAEVLTIPDLLARAVEKAPDAPALVMPFGSWTYAELDAGVSAVAGALHALGIRNGDHVGLLAPNSPEFLEGFLAIVSIGAVAVPLNVRYKSAELGHVIRDADLVALLTTDRMDEHVDLAELVCDAVPGLREAPNPRRVELDGFPKLAAVATLRGDAAGAILSRPELEQLASGVRPEEVEELRRRVRVRDLATLLYTSGTTSHPKGCMHTHESMTRGPAGRALSRFATDAEREAYWVPGPLFHVGSLSPFIGCMAAAGTALTDTHFDPARALALITENDVTSAWPWFPYVTSAVLDLPDFDPARLPNLRYIGQIGPRSLFERLDSLLPGAELVKSSGMTEAAGTFGFTMPDEDLDSRIATQGKAIPGVEVKVVEPETDVELPPETRGELMFRGFLVMEGYYNDPEKTAATLDADRWLRSGDEYSITADGSLVFHGRLKDMLKVGGENVAAMEIEDYVEGHPAVACAEVVGRPDEKLDEVPVVFVELKPGEEVEAETLIEFCVGRLASYKVPREVFFVEPDQWPMSATKVSKPALREIVQRAESAA